MKSAFMSGNNLSRIHWAKHRIEIAIVCAAIIMLLSSGFSRLDSLIYDSIMSINPLSSKSHVAIIAIDDKSLASIGRWPWTRDKHAQLINNLADKNTKAIGFDLLFVDSDTNHPQSDEKFASALKTSNQVILTVSPASYGDHAVTELLPLPTFASNAAGLGHVDLEIDSDGIIRQVYLYAGWQESRWPSFSLALASIANPSLKIPDQQTTTGNAWTRRQASLINFEPKQAIAKYSYIDVLENKIPKSLLENRILLVGVTATGLSNVFATPLSFNHQNMSGVEINARIVNGLLNNNQLSKIPLWLTVILSLLFLAAAIFSYTRVKAKQQIYVLLTSTIGCFSLSLALFYLANIWFAPSIIIVLLVILYLLFSVIHTKETTEQMNDLYHDLHFDTVTQLPNHKKIHQQIDLLLNQAITTKQKYALVIINIGRFKGVNDLLGFQTGNKLLSIVAKRINNKQLDNLLCARFNGPEFIVFFPMSTVAQTNAFCQNLYKSLSEPFVIKEHKFTLPISVGVSIYPDDARLINDLFDCAISAMHRAKEQPNRGVCHYHHDIKETVVERNRIENDLSRALERNEFELYYQPQICSMGGDIIGVEALIRWHHAEKGIVQPNEFIPIAESTGLIVNIGDWVLRQACKQAKIWQQQSSKTIRVAVNISAVQFAQSDMVDKIQQILIETNLSPESLELELTESCLMQDMANAIATLKQLKSMGIKLSIDDFGTGYSSLSYLKNFPMDRIKIDRLFISELQNNHDVREITLAIISMAHSLNMVVVAEGVESAEQQRFLSENSCEELQGFLFSKPLPEIEITKLLIGTNKTT